MTPSLFFNVEKFTSTFKRKSFYVIILIIIVDLWISDLHFLFQNSTYIPRGYEGSENAMQLYIFDLSTHITFVFLSLIIALYVPKRELILFLVVLANFIIRSIDLMDFLLFRNEGYINIKDYLVIASFILAIGYGVRTYRRKNGTSEEIVNVTNIALLKMLIPNKEVTTVNNLLDEKDKVSSEYNSLLYHLQHQIKQPFTSLEGLMQLEESELRQQMISKCIQDVKSYLHELTHLDYISNYYKLNPQLLKFRTVFNEVKAKINHANKVHIHYYESKVDDFKMDETLLSTILEKLIQNAVNFSKDTAFQKPNVNVYIYTHDQGLILEVKDEGIGIEEHNKEKIFDMFFKGSLKSSGVGLGLYIVKKTVEKLKGKIELESNLGNGTSVKVTIPPIKESQSSDSSKVQQSETAA